MAKDSELNMTLKYITGIDISFVIDDIIGYFVDPNIPVNIDENFSIDVDSPHGMCNIATKYVEDHYEVIFKRFISETYYEEYKLNLNDEDFLKLEGNTIELRDKGYVIKDIKKKYMAGDIAVDNEENIQIYEESTVKVNSLIYVSKKQRVYLKKDLRSHYGKNLFKKLINDKKPYEMLTEFYPYMINPKFVNTVAMYETLSHCNSRKSIDVIIDGEDCSWLYPMLDGDNLLDGDNIVRRTYNLYEGIINKENYYDALNLIGNFEFAVAFSYEDCKVHNEETTSINEIIDDLAGNPTVNFRKEYSSYVINIVNNYYKSLNKHPFLFDVNGVARHHKKLKLEKNNYIKQILLSNQNTSEYDTKKGNE